MGRRAANVEKYTKQGVEELQNGNLNKALEEFEAALKYAEKLKDGFAIRACAFNLGAIYIALKQTKNGLAMLQKAIPPNGTKDGKSNGDLFYNFGLGYESIQKNDDAVKYFELALDEYQSESSSYAMVAEVASRIGKLYHHLKKPLLASRAYGVAAQGYRSLGNCQNQASSLSHQAAALHAANKPEEALQCLDDCMILCQQIKDFNILGQLYNEIGLIYFQCKDNPQAALCFELALPLCKNDKSDMEKKAVILQNLGAIFNSLGDYQRAVTLHETAAQLHAENGDRNSQGACFLNLAFAYSQLEDNEGAGECYLHALQAAKDAGDHRGQWQAMEGLGAVYFHLGKVEKSVKYYKMALATMAAAGSFPEAQERIVGKLTDALQFKLSGNGHRPRVPKLQSQYSSGTSSIKSDPRNPSLFVNDAPRPPTRQESMTRAALAIERIKGIRERQQRPFTPIALGIGMYDSESDLSVSDHGRRSKFSHRSASADRSLKKKRSQNGRMTKAVSDSDVSSIADRKLRKRYSELYPSESKQKVEQNLMRRQERALLKNESYDDDLALRAYMRGLKSSSDDESVDGSRNREIMAKASRSVKDLDLKEKILETMVKEHTMRKSEKEKLRSGIAEVYEESHSTPPESDFGNSRRRSVRSRRKLSRHKPDEEEEESSTVSVTESDDSSTISGDSGTQRTESSPPHSKSPTPPPPPKPLISTYEKPVTRTPNENVPHLSGNYFTPEKKKDPKPGTSSVDGPIQRTYVQDESDPLYQTINSLKSTLREGNQVPPAPSGHSANEQSGEETEDEAPPLPARNNESTGQKEFQAMSRGERERYLFQYQQKRDQNARDPGSADFSAEDKVLVPDRNTQKSRHCIVM